MVIYPSKMLIFQHDITRKSSEITTETPRGKLAPSSDHPPWHLRRDVRQHAPSLGEILAPEMLGL
jgi:hypothetical protein